MLVRPESDQVATLDGRAALFATDADGHQVYFEEVRLTVAGQAAHHLDSVVEPFTLSDLPVAVWYVGDVPEPNDPLLSVATAVIVDSRDAAGSGRMRSLLELARRRTVVDLSWIRLRPWRELLADLFASPPATNLAPGSREPGDHRQDRAAPAARRVADGPAPPPAQPDNPHRRPARRDQAGVPAGGRAGHLRSGAGPVAADGLRPGHDPG